MSQQLSSRPAGGDATASVLAVASYPSIDPPAILSIARVLYTFITFAGFFRPAYLASRPCPPAALQHLLLSSSMWPTGTTQLQATGQSGGMPITIAITELQRPPVPSVLSVQDRQVYVDNIQAPPPGYVLARRWMRNDPDVDVEHIAGSHNHLLLPRPLPAGPRSSDDDAPAFPDDSEDYDPEEAVKALKQHWVNVRKHDTAERLQRVDRYSERLKAVMSPSMHVNAAMTHALLAQQQHIQQQHLQQHGQPLTVLLGAAQPGAALPLAASAVQQQQPQQQQAAAGAQSQQQAALAAEQQDPAAASEVAVTEVQQEQHQGGPQQQQVVAGSEQPRDEQQQQQ